MDRIYLSQVRLIERYLNETYSNVRICKYLSYNILIQSGLKQIGALTPLLLNFALGYAIRNVQKYQVGLILNGTH
jgi:hypothetical protein